MVASNSPPNVIEGRPRDIGGFNVRRLLPNVQLRSVGPFVFFDHLGPAVFPAGQGIDVRPHPHIGLATVTWLFDGALDHRDSIGTVQTIRPGAVNWMTAGRGIVHSERTPQDLRQRGHRIEAIQTWVALPISHEEQEPDFRHYPAEMLPDIPLGAGAHAVLIAGTSHGHVSPVEFPSDILQMVVEAREPCAFEAPSALELAVYVVAGYAEFAGYRLNEGQFAAIDGEVSLRLPTGARVMFVGGAPLGGHRHLDWNFVASSRERLGQARDDWRASIAAGFNGTRFRQPPGEAAWIPYPGDAHPAPDDTSPSTG